MFSEYTGTQAKLDQNMFQNMHRSRVLWSGYGEVDNSPDVNLYLKRPFDNNAQALYVPAGIYGGLFYNVVAYDADTPTVWQDTSANSEEFYRASGGNVTLAVGSTTIGVGCTLTPTANTTVQGIEMIVSDAGSDENLYVWVELDLWWVDTLHHLTNTKWYPAAATAALTAAE